MSFERTMPHSLDAERAVLGAVIIEPAVFDVVAARIQRPDFYRQAHQRIWSAIVRLHEHQTPPDLVPLVQALRDSSDLEEVGGPAYVASLIDGIPKSTNVEHYAAIVKAMSTKRALILAATTIIDDAHEAGVDDIDGLVDRAENTVMTVGQNQVALRGDFLLAEEWMREMYGYVSTAAETKRRITGVPSGLSGLDFTLRGFQPSDLVLIAARPSTGKSSLMMQIALHASQHVPVGVISLEMSRKMLGFRALALEARVDAFRLMTGDLSEYELRLVAEAMTRIGERRLWIDDAGGQTPAGMRAKARQLAHRHGLRLLIIDYMQLMRDGEKHENRNQEISVISAGMKDLAKDLDIPIIVLSQLTRDADKQGGNRRPELWHLRDSGSLEQDADVVLMLHRPGQHADGERYKDGEEAEILIRKQRNGPTGLIKAQWVAEQMRFAERAPEQPAREPQQQEARW